MIDSREQAKQLVILSGKGGTGKTSVSAAFAHLSSLPAFSAPAVFADADVDAANLGLALKAVREDSNEFRGGTLAAIDPTICSGCGACENVCRFDAVLAPDGNRSAYQIDASACDGCAACVYACPNEAIRMVPQQDGLWFRSSTPYGALFHAELFPGKENSGKLVTLVKQMSRLWAEKNQASLVIVDGPPGIGCPVISACSGADLALIVTEPSLAGLHDLERVLGVLRHFKVPAALCINKADVYEEGARQIRKFAQENDLEMVGEIPFDEHAVQAVLKGIPLSEIFPHSPASNAIQNIWQKSIRRLFPV